MRNDSSTQANLYSIMNLNTFGVFVFKIDVISNEDLPVNPNTSETVKKRTECGCPGQKARQLV